MFGIVFLAYAQMGLLLFGNVHYDFRNFKESLLTMIRMILGDFDYEGIEEANRILGPIYFLTYILLVFFILLVFINSPIKKSHISYFNIVINFLIFRICSWPSLMIHIVV